jgi:hypothetical protein
MAPLATVPIPDSDVSRMGSVVQKMAFLFDGREAAGLGSSKDGIPEVVVSAGAVTVVATSTNGVVPKLV